MKTTLCVLVIFPSICHWMFSRKAMDLATLTWSSSEQAPTDEQRATLSDVLFSLRWWMTDWYWSVPGRDFDQSHDIDLVQWQRSVVSRWRLRLRHPITAYLSISVIYTQRVTVASFESIRPKISSFRGQFARQEIYSAFGNTLCNNSATYFVHSECQRSIGVHSVSKFIQFLERA